jgi:hypothetical protein
MKPQESQTMVVGIALRHLVGEAVERLVGFRHGQYTAEMLGRTSGQCRCLGAA